MMHARTVRVRRLERVTNRFPIRRQESLGTGLLPQDKLNWAKVRHRLAV